MIMFSVIYKACNSENFKGDCESPTVSALSLLDMDSCRDFVSFFFTFSKHQHVKEGEANKKSASTRI